VYGYANIEDCNTKDYTEIDTLTTPAVITIGTNNVSVSGNSSLSTSDVFKRKNNITVNGINATDGSVITIGGTQLTIELYNGCQNYPG